MSVGPVQLIVLGFDRPDFHAEIMATLERLRAGDAVQVIDAVAVRKDAAGGLEVTSLSTLDPDEILELGSEIAALLGVGLTGQESAAGDMPDTWRGLRSASHEDPWDVLAQIPDGSAGALILVEHRWAADLGVAVAHAGGFRIGAAVVDPRDLLAAGVLSREEAAGQEQLLTSRAVS